MRLELLTERKAAIPQHGRLRKVPHSGLGSLSTLSNSPQGRCVAFEDQASGVTESHFCCSPLANAAMACPGSREEDTAPTLATGAVSKNSSHVLKLPRLWKEAITILPSLVVSRP